MCWCVYVLCQYQISQTYTREDGGGMFVWNAGNMLLFDDVLAAPNISRRARSDSNQLAVFTQCRPI